MNKVFMVGRVASEPQFRTTQSGVKQATYRLAVRRRTAGTNNDTDFYSIVAWRAHADFTEKYIKKGIQLVIDGHLEAGEYTDKNGIRRSTTQVVVDNTEFVGNRPESTAGEDAATVAETFEAVNDPNLPF